VNTDLRPPSYVVLDGELDVFRKDEIASLLPDPHAVGSIVVNCFRASYIDSTIIGMLVGLRREFVANGGEPGNFILLLGKDSIVHRAFELAGVTALFALAFVGRGIVKGVVT